MLRATAVAMVRPFVSSMPLEPTPQSTCLESVDGKYFPGGGMLIYDSTVRQLQLPAEKAKYLVAGQEKLGLEALQLERRVIS